MAVTGSLAFRLTCRPACVRMTLRGFDGGAPGVPDPGARLSVDGQAYRISACLSGDRAYFQGVDLVDETREPFLRVLIDPLEGPRLKLFRGGQERPIVLGHDDCSELRVAVRPTRWRVNHVRDVEGVIGMME